MEEISKEDQKAMDEGMESYHKAEEERYKKDQKVLDSIKKEVSPKFYEKIEEEMAESEGGWDVKIVDKPTGENQDNNDREVWVDQHAVGQSGDSWAGYVYIKLPTGKYLRWDYAM